MTKDEKRVAHVRRLLAWGTPALGVLLLPLLAAFEEDAGLRLLFEWRGSVAPPSEVVVIGIDENTEDELGREPDRAMHAQLIDRLSRAGASTIVFDVFMLDEMPDDRALAEAMAAAGNVILGAFLKRDFHPGGDRQQLVPPAEVLKRNALGMAPSIVPEHVPVTRAILRDDGDRPTLPVLALLSCEYDDLMALLVEHRPDVAMSLPRTRAEIRPDWTLERIFDRLRAAFVSDPTLADDLSSGEEEIDPGLRSLMSIYEPNGVFHENRLYPNYYGPPRTVRTLSYQQALTRGFDDDEVAGKVIFVGFSARQQPGQRDDIPYVYSANGFNIAGVEMAATVFANLLQDTDVKRPDLLSRTVLVLVWGVLIAGCFGRLRFRLGLMVGCFLTAGYLLTALWTFRGTSFWLPVMVPAIQVLFAGSVCVRVKQLVDRVSLGIGAGEEASLALTGRGEKEKIDDRVVLFADQQGSKKWWKRVSAELDPVAIRKLQAEFAVVRDRPIAQNGGHVGHMLADSLLTYWITQGPQDLKPQIDAACRAVLAIHDGISDFNRAHQRFELPMRFGLDWGRITSGLNPSPLIKDWKLDGQPIHVAERLESLNKILGTWILISDRIADRIDHDEFWAPQLGTFIFFDEAGDDVIGPVRVHELRDVADVSTETRNRAASLGEALVAIRQQDWDTAIAALSLLESSPEYQQLVSGYLDWCRESRREKPNCRWRGTVRVSIADKSQILGRHLE